jgi:hypothetical protein
VHRGRRGRSVGAGTRERVSRQVSCVGRRPVGAGWRNAGEAECGAAAGARARWCG